jgi:hypothetical protein
MNPDASGLSGGQFCSSITAEREVPDCFRRSPRYNVSITTKSAAANGLTKQETKYRNLIDDCWQQFKEVQKEIRRQQAKSERLRAASRRTMNDTWEVLRRVEATL